MSVRHAVHKVDVTYILGIAVVVFTVQSHEYNPGAFMFAAACMGLPSLYRWEAKKNGNGTNKPVP